MFPTNTEMVTAIKTFEFDHVEMLFDVDINIIFFVVGTILLLYHTMQNSKLIAMVEVHEAEMNAMHKFLDKIYYHIDSAENDIGRVEELNMKTFKKIAKLRHELHSFGSNPPPSVYASVPVDASSVYTYETRDTDTEIIGDEGYAKNGN